MRSLALCLICYPVIALAAPPRQTELGVDQVVLKSGTRLAGAVVNKRDGGALQVAVRREWLRKRNAAYFEKQEAQERETTRTALKVVLERIEAWKTERAADERLVKFLDKEATRLKAREEALAGDEPVDLPRFLLITVPRANIESMYVQPANRKQVALVSWDENLDEVENTSVTKLAADLKKRSIDLASRTVDLSSELPPQPDDEQQWAVRKSLVEFYKRKSLVFQGTMDKVYRTDDPDGAPEIPELFNDLIRSQLNAQLGDLLGTPAKPNTANSEKSLRDSAKIADKEDATGFRINRLSLQPAQLLVTVESRFMARLPDGTWITAWQHAETIDATKPQPNAKDLAQNEQVKKVLDVAKAAGIGDDQKVQDALRAGAATMSAQDSAAAKFQDFFARYTTRLDGPPLFLPSSKP